MPIYIRNRATNASGGCLIIERTVTSDMDDGQPLPPLIEDGIVWCVVDRHAGCTTWRRIFLATSSVTDWRTVPEDQSRAP